MPNMIPIRLSTPARQLRESVPAAAEREREKISFVSGGRDQGADSGPVFRPTVETSPPY
jgi:hypothetical protein